MSGEWDEAVGPFFQFPESPELEQARDVGAILALPVDGGYVYPTFQFEYATEGAPSMKALPGLADVVGVLQEYLTDPWEQALWLNSPMEGEGETAAQKMRQGEISWVVREAERDVWRWKQ